MKPGENELEDYKARMNPSPEELNNLGKNLANMQKMVHVTLEVESMKGLNSEDKATIIKELAQTLTDEQVREVILTLQKMLCVR